jgi:hypothetical protein
MSLASAAVALLLAQNIGEAPVAPRTPSVPRRVVPGNDGGVLAQQQMQLPGLDADPLPTDAEIARVPVPPDLLQIARALDSDSYAERAAAREQLSARKAPANELMAVLLRRDLTVDARHAFVSQLAFAIMNAPRGALGIRMEGPLMRETGVRVTGLVPGMPAERVLEVGDLLREIDGKPLVDRSELIRTVQSLAPGVEIQLLVRRIRRDAGGRVLVGADGAELTDELRVKMRLGSTQDLEGNGDPNGVANPMAAARAAQIAEAERRFLPAPTVVAFPDREKPAPPKPATLDGLRKQVALLQLSGADPEVMKSIRARIEDLALMLKQASDPATREKLQGYLDALAVEIRAMQ